MKESLFWYSSWLSLYGLGSFVILQLREHSQIIIEQCSVGVLRVFEVKFLHHHSLPQSRCINNGYNFWDTFRIQALWKFISTSTVLQVSKKCSVCSGAAAFIGEGIDFTHTHVGYWKAMSCEECQQNFRLERYINSFSEQWFYCSPEQCDTGEVLVKICVEWYLHP